MEVLKIAIPNKGRLSEKIYDLLNCAGLVFPSKDERTLQVTTKDKKYSIIFVRTQDIPMFVENGIADIGFTGFDILTELKSNVDKIMDLDFGYCEMVVAVKDEDTYKTSADLPQNLKIATSFPNIAKEYFEKLGNKLRIIDKILESTAIVIANKNLSEEKKEKTQIVLRALKSVIDAREKKYLMAHVPKSSLDEIRAFLPGLSSPTIMTLAGDDEHVVMHVVVDADKVFDSIDNLKKLGGQGILIMTVDQMVR